MSNKSKQQQTGAKRRPRSRKRQQEENHAAAYAEHADAVADIAFEDIPGGGPTYRDWANFLQHALFNPLSGSEDTEVSTYVRAAGKMALAIEGNRNVQSAARDSVHAFFLANFAACMAAMRRDVLLPNIARTVEAECKKMLELGWHEGGHRKTLRDSVEQMIQATAGKVIADAYDVEVKVRLVAKNEERRSSLAVVTDDEGPRVTS